MDVPSREFVFAGSLDELKAKGRLVLHGHHRPILVIYDRGRVFTLDNRCQDREAGARRSIPRHQGPPPSGRPQSAEQRLRAASRSCPGTRMPLTALADLLPMLPEEEAYLALFHGARRVAADCDWNAAASRTAS
jgi:hypothetical protein